MKLAFRNIKNETFIGKAIIWYTSKGLKSKFNGEWKKGFSHVELVVDGISCSASQYENKVRCKRINYNPSCWEFIELPVSYTQRHKVGDFFKDKIGKKYDYLGILGFIFGNRDSRDKWFCSEICTEALKQAGIIKWNKDSARVSPNDLYEFFLEGEV